MINDEYLTVSGLSTGIFRDRGSKFIALVYRVSNIEEVESCLEKARKEYRDARHHCYAYRLGIKDDAWRVNDDGEPTGSAGKPILGQISSFEITNVLIVVVRYFGGTLLGVGGLINAYRSAAKDALQNNKIITELLMSDISINFPYAAMNNVMKIIKDEHLEQSNQKFDLSCSIHLRFRLSSNERIISRLSKVDQLEIIYPE